MSGTATNVGDVAQIDKLLHGEESYVCADAGYGGIEKRAEHEVRESGRLPLALFKHHLQLSSKPIMKRRLFTYHENASTGIGGIEVLIRNIQRISIKNKIKPCEIFYGVSGEKISEEVDGVEKVNLKNLNLLPKKIASLANKLAMTLFIKKQKPTKDDFVIIFKPINLIFFSSRFIKKCKLVCVQSNRVDKISPPKILKKIINNKIKNIHAFTVYTEHDKNEIIKEFNITSEKVFVIPRGCKISTEKEPNTLSHKLISICRIDNTQKNLSGMISIFNKLPASYTLSIYGSGDPNEIASLMEMINGNPRITFHGPCQDVKYHLRKHSIFLMTSHYEGFGQTLIEARSQGLPIVAFDTFPALHWIVKEGVNGYIAPPYDEDRFCEAIINATKNSKTYNYLSRQALEMAADTESERIDTLWRSMLS